MKVCTEKCMPNIAKNSSIIKGLILTKEQMLSSLENTDKGKVKNKIVSNLIGERKQRRL